jgi:hypothetical protein
MLGALQHRLRREILRQLHCSDYPLSPAELGRLLDVPVTNLSYHVGILAQSRAVAMVDQRPVRGAVEHFYESRVGDNKVIREILLKTRAEDEREA